jgi:hypothetical protein
MPRRVLLLLRLFIGFIALRLSRRGSAPVFLLLLLLPGLQSCQSPVPRETGAGVLAPLVIDASARSFRLLTEQSELIVLVYRAGRLANLGHNHVVSSADLTGEIYLADSLADSVFEIRLPVLSMDVDLPQQRLAAGDDFPGEIDPEAVSGTRANMLGEQQLNAAVWPEIVMRSRGVHGVLPDITVEVEIAVRSHIHAVKIPMHVELSGERMVASGRFQLNQTDLDIDPFSVMMGALKVRNQLDIEFSIVAAAESSAN